MKRKIALAIGTSLLCIAILTGCNSSVAAEDAFSAANSGDTENAQKLYTNIIDNSSEQKEQLKQIIKEQPNVTVDTLLKELKYSIATKVEFSVFENVLHKKTTYFSNSFSEYFISEAFIFASKLTKFR